MQILLGRRGRAHTRCHPTGLKNFGRREQRAARRRTESETLKFNYPTWLVLQQILPHSASSETVSIGLNILLPSEFDGRETFVLSQLETEPSSIIKSLLLITISFFRVQLENSQKVLNEYYPVSNISHINLIASGFMAGENKSAKTE
jgi:hypothetical protein